MSKRVEGKKRGGKKNREDEKGRGRKGKERREGNSKGKVVFRGM